PRKFHLTVAIGKGSFCDEPTPLMHAPFNHLQHLGDHGHVFSDGKAQDGCERTPGFVATRVVPKKLPHRLIPERFLNLLHLRALENVSKWARESDGLHTLSLAVAGDTIRY